MSRTRLTLLVVPLLLAAGTPLPGQERPSEIAAAPRAEPVRIDGALDDAAWGAAPRVTGFVQGEPVEGAAVQEPTEVRVLYDAEALYVGLRMHDQNPERIARQLVRRDERGQYDYVEVSLDPDRDRRTGYLFRVTAAGVQGDAYLYDDVREDDSWDAVWQSAVRHDSAGWTAELRIPLSQLRFRPAAAPQTWGINVKRRRVASNEVSFLALESRRRHGRVSVFAPLSGLLLAEEVPRLELRPYTLARGRLGPSDPADPFSSGREAELGGGLDLRYGVGANFTLDATVNPDFGQVEVDPAVINLSAFETFYPERRPFFVEDARVFDFNLSGGNNSLFYSRRIGREPHRRELDGADFLASPDQTAILGAAKLTGRTGGGLSVGALAAVTGREEARAYFVGGDSTVAFVAEPPAEYGVLRLQQDLRNGGSVIGGILTGVHRRLPGDGSFDFLPSAAFNAGVDFEHTWRERAWALWGFLAGSHVRGDPEALIALQRGSSHYFQRPDAYGLGVDSSAHSMTGAEWRLQLERRSGRHWTGAVWLAQRTPGFDVNDLGYFRGSERLDGGARVSYQEITPGSVLREYRLSAFTFHNWRHEALRDPWSYDVWGHAHKAGAVNASADLTFLNYWTLDASVSYRPEVLDDAATRGGPLLSRPAEVGMEGRLSTDRRQELSLEPSFGMERSRAGTTSWTTALELTYRPLPQLELEMEPRYGREEEAAQYVAQTAEIGYAPTYGRRYLFGDLRQRILTLDTRLNLALSPTLTLQTFLQPLLSAGDFVGYKQLTRPESFAFEPFQEGEAVAAGGGTRCMGGRTCAAGGTRFVDFDGDTRPDFSFGERDFRVRSLRGNAVMRWEYRPGSTIFLVWQQQRSYEDLEAAEFRLGSAFGDLLLDEPENVLIVKASYWLSL